MFDNVKVTKVGWTALPVFHSGNYCNSDLYQLPLINMKKQKQFFDYYLE